MVSQRDMLKETYSSVEDSGLNLMDDHFLVALGLKMSDLVLFGTEVAPAI